MLQNVMTENNNDLTKSYQLEGIKLDIVTYPAPVLSKKAIEVVEFGPELVDLCKNMLYTMYRAPGIGLAAPQVGKSLRIFVMDIDFEREEVVEASGDKSIRLGNFQPYIFINPVIVESHGKFKYEEGCLSVPGFYEEVERAQDIIVEYQDVLGKMQRLEASDLRAVCIQHELDHLDGIVFIERLSLLKKNLIKKKILKKKKKAALV